MFPYDFLPCDKQRFSDGPWQGEVDSYEWLDRLSGLHCAIIRHTAVGSLLGYVAVPKGHKLHRVGYRDLVDIPPGSMERLVGMEDVGVFNLLIGAHEMTPTQAPLSLITHCHEGLSYSAMDDRGNWWFGFDCGHSHDLAPGIPYLFEWQTYRDFPYVKKQVERLALQIKCIAEGIPFMEKKDEEVQEGRRRGDSESPGGNGSPPEGRDC